MKPAHFDYVRPKHLADAIDLLSNGHGEAQVMAGGQSLVPMMNMRVAAPDLVIDISRLDELCAASETPEHVLLGACVTHAAVEDAAVPDPSRGLMPHVAANLAYRAVRTRGTLGGSLALSDPAADWPTVMAALDAEVLLQGKRGARAAAAVGFAVGIYETVRAPDEIVEAIRIPKLSAQARWGYSKFCRKTGELASSIAAVVRDPARNYARVRRGRWPADRAHADLAACAHRPGGRPGGVHCPGFGRARAAIRRFSVQLACRHGCARGPAGFGMSELSLRVNGKLVRDDVPARLSLADFLRERRNLTGTHLGCEHGVCGACTILLDGEPVRSCLAFALACEGREIVTIEGFGEEPLMRVLRQAFHEHHALQCGFCTPSMLITARDIIRRKRAGSEQQIRKELAGNLCRCTGYTNIVNAIAAAAASFEREGAGALPIPGGSA
jgi:carbon-monoxide dehydrogenase medium subunit